MKVVKDLKDLNNRCGPASVILCVIVIGLYHAVSIVIPTILMAIGAMVFCGSIPSPIEFPMDYDWMAYWLCAAILWLMSDSVMLRLHISRIEKRTQEGLFDDNRT